MVHKNQAHDDPVDSTLKASHQPNKITQSMIGNSWEYCGDYNAGPTSSKEQKSPSWCTLTMLTCDITENHAKLDHAWLDTLLRTAPRDCMTELESGCSGSVTCTRGSIPRMTCMRPDGLFRRIFGEYSVSPRPPYNPFSYPVCGVRLLTVKPLFHLF